MEKALNIAKLKGAQYADIRLVLAQQQEIEVKNGVVEALVSSEDMGFGIRVLKNGCWGFASSHRLEVKEAEEVAALAVKVAEASSLVPGEAVRLASQEPLVAQYKTPATQDPFKVSLEEKIKLLLAADELMRREPKVKITRATQSAIHTKKYFASTEGAFIEQELMETGAGIQVWAMENSEVQLRSYPNAHRGGFATGGYEYILGLDFLKHAPRIAEEAAALLSAPPCPSATATLVLEGGQLALQIHESCGHPIELDRVFGMEASYAGTSFLTPEKLGSFRYGSPLVNIVADATVPGGLGTFGYDDEGVPAQRVPVITEGIFVGYLSSRETAVKLGEKQKSGGSMRASSWNRIPLIRMTNINLNPGETPYEEIIAGTEDGILIATNKSWSIDDKRLNFQFGAEIAWEIKKGKSGRMLKNPTYTGITPQFWGSCDAVADKTLWQVYGTPNCGKGEPSQLARVGHGCSAARFRNVRVGVGGK